MNIKLRLILLVGLFFLAMTMGVIGLRFNESRYLEVLYQDRQNQAQRSMTSLLALNSQLLEQILNGYTHSDDIFRFASDPTIFSVAQDLQSKVNQGEVSAIWVFNSTGEKVHLAARPDLSAQAETLVFPTQMMRAVRQADDNLHFFLRVPEGDIYELYSAAIYPRLSGTAVAPVGGWLLVARRWDQSYLLHLSELLGGNVRLSELTNLNQTSSSWMGDFARDVIIQYPLVSWDGQPLLVVVEAHYELPIVDAVLGILDRDTIFNIVLAFLFAAAFGLALYLWVYVPIEDISASLETNRQEPLEGLLKDKRTEFGRIARLIQQSFQFQGEMDTEIARRRMVEFALRDSESTYRALIDFSIQGFAIFQDDQIVFTNLALAEGLGYSQDDLAALPRDQVSSLFHADDQARVVDYLQNCPINAPLQDERMKVRMKRKDGTFCWMEIFASPVEHNGMPAVQMAFLDVTKRERAEQAYQTEQEFVLAILDTVKSIIVVLDRDGCLVQCNPACEQAVGMSSADMQGRPLWDLFWTPVGSMQEEILRLIHEQIVLVYEDAFFVANGPARSISWSNGFIFDAQGQVKYMVGTGIDLNERKQRERQQAAIAALASALRGLLTRKDILQVIVEQTTRFLQCDVVSVEMHRPETSEFVVERVTGALSISLQGLVSSDSTGIGARVLQTGEPYLSNQLGERPELLPEDLRGKLCAGGWVPLIADGNPLGLVFAGSSRPIDASDFQLLISVADIAASALYRSLLAEEMQQQVQRLTALHTINIAINASLDVRMTLQLLVSEITMKLGVDATDVLLINKLTGDLTYAAGYGFRSRESEKSRFWLGEGNAGQVAINRRPIYLYDENGITNEFPQLPWINGEEFVAYEAVALTNKGELKGVLETFHRAPYQPDPDWPRFLESLAMQVSIAINNTDLLERLQRNNQELGLAYDATIEGWARALEMRDEETQGHTQRVTEWTVRLAQGMGIGGEELLQIRRGALMHDMGKMGIPDSILRKKGPLDDAEWAIMREHPRMAFEMMSPIKFLGPALIIPFSHHERWDGSGYPQKLSRQQIPLAARIFAVVDVWDALHHGRIYRPATPETEVFEYFRQEAGRLFDPDVVEAFIELRTVSERHV